ncbi:MAG: hypothetical protein LBH59_08915 [Planctomycetaceae bacterium]|nr:hypothetical protein [Planctomycetaceae bacterium]
MPCCFLLLSFRFLTYHRNNCKVFIPKPVWTVGFALEQTLRGATLTVFSYVDFKVASA